MSDPDEMPAAEAATPEPEQEAHDAPESVFMFRPSLRYAIFFVVATLVVLLFVVSLIGRFDWGSLFFLGVGLVGMGWSGELLLSRVELDVDEIRLRRPWRRPQQVAFRQMDALHSAGRLFPAFVFTYHPLQPDGLLDLQSVEALTVPAVEEQELLIELLKARAPRLKLDD